MSTAPTDAELEALAVEHEAFGFGRADKQGLSTHGFDPDGLQKFARAVLAKWGTPPAVAGEPVAWLSTDSIGERYLCFTKPNDSDPARPLVFGDTTPHPTQAQAGAVPLTVSQICEWWASENGLEDCEMCKITDFLRVVRAVEEKHGIKGGQHGSNT